MLGRERECARVILSARESGGVLETLGDGCGRQDLLLAKLPSPLSSRDRERTLSTRVAETDAGRVRWLTRFAEAGHSAPLASRRHEFSTDPNGSPSSTASPSRNPKTSWT